MSITFFEQLLEIKSGSKNRHPEFNSCLMSNQRTLFLNSLWNSANKKCNRFHVKLSKHKPISNVQNYTGSDISSQFPRSSTLVNRIKPSQAINTTYHPKKARQGAWNATNAAVSVKRKNANTVGSKYSWTLIIDLLGTHLTPVRQIWSLYNQTFLKT